MQKELPMCAEMQLGKSMCVPFSSDLHRCDSYASSYLSPYYHTGFSQSGLCFAVMLLFGFCFFFFIYHCGTSNSSGDVLLVSQRGLFTTMGWGPFSQDPCSVWHSMGTLGL